MTQPDEKLYSAVVAAVRPSGSGLFAWDMLHNRFHGDDEVARLVGLDPRKLAAGIPMADYLARLHADDRGTAAKIIHDSILSGYPEHQSYRVLSHGNSVTTVVVNGQCFRDSDGVTSLYSGIIYKPGDGEAPDTAELCQAALVQARDEGDTEVAVYLELALKVLGRRGEN